jgi:uncharacterized membrane protein
MFAGLAVNWTLPLLNITDKPLALVPILISFDIFLVAFSIIAYYRNKDLKYEIKPLKLDTTNRIFFIIPMLFPAMSILGAFILNNNGPNYLTMIMLGGIAVYVFMIVLYRDKLNENVYPWALWLIGLSILFSGWLRGSYVGGTDISLEQYLFKLTFDNSIWPLGKLDNSFGSLLSVTIFPLCLKTYSGISPQLTFKIFFPLLFSIAPVMVYMLSKHYLNETTSFIAGFFFISQLYFFNWFSIPIRQEIGLIFFGIICILIFNNNLNLRINKIFLIIFFFSLVVSHYSTTYIALSIIACITLVPIKYYKIRPKHSNKYFSIILIIIIFVFSFLWYSQLTETSTGLEGFIKRSIGNMGNIFSEDVQAQGNSPLDQFNIFKTQRTDPTIILNRYINTTEQQYLNENQNLFDKEIISKYPYSIKYSLVDEPKISQKATILFIIFGELIKKIAKILIILGTILLLFTNRKDLGKKEFLLLFSFIFLTIFVFIPFASIDYDMMRFYQQVLMVLSISPLFLINLIKRPLLRKYLLYSLTLLCILLFIITSGLLNQNIGGMDTPVRLTNSGFENDFYLSHQSDIYGAKWLLEVAGKESPIYADGQAVSRLYSAEVRIKRPIIKDIFPSVVRKNSYVYLDKSNLDSSAFFIMYSGDLLKFGFSYNFFSDNKNKIYNNGGSATYK